MDVRDAASVEAAVRDLVSAAGSLHALVCCAGYSVFGSVEEVAIDQARAQLETNVIGTLTTLRAALPHLRASRGRVVVLGSLAGRAPIPFQAHYSASKAALDALTLALRMETAPFGVAVSLVEPGDIRTPFNDNMEWGPGADARSPYAERRCALRGRGPGGPAGGPRPRDRGRGDPSCADRAASPRALHDRTGLHARADRPALPSRLARSQADPPALRRVTRRRGPRARPRSVRRSAGPWSPSGAGTW